MDGYREVVAKYYQIYRLLQKKHDLREQGHFENRNNCIEIWEYKDGREERCICKITDDEPEGCYKRAAEDLRNYKKKMEEIQREISTDMAS